MKITLLSVLLIILFMVPANTYAVKPVNPPSKQEIKDAKKAAKKEWKSLSKDERKSRKAEVKEAIRQSKESDGDTNLLLLVILAILLPPVAMVLFEGGITGRFWISLLLTLLFFLPGVIYTLVVILGDGKVSRG